MMKRGLTIVAVMAVALTTTASGQQQQPQQRAGPVPSIDERTSGMRKLDGYFPLYWDERGGALYLEISRFDSDFLFTTGLSAGLGSNDIGLDRGRGGAGRVVRFQRVGPRVLLVQPNQSFRSSSSNPLERRAVEDSFARSVLWGFAVAAESSSRVLIDATGARYSFPTIVALLRRAGVRVARFLPTLAPWRLALFNLRSHRKIVVVDGETAFTGGINFSHAYRIASRQIKGKGFSRQKAIDQGWRDTHLGVRGTGARHLEKLFRDTWRDAECEGEVQPAFHDFLIVVRFAQLPRLRLDQSAQIEHAPLRIEREVSDVGRRHHRVGKNRTDGASAAPHIPMRHLLALVLPISATMRPFLAK